MKEYDTMTELDLDELMKAAGGVEDDPLVDDPETYRESTLYLEAYYKALFIKYGCCYDEGFGYLQLQMNAEEKNTVHELKLKIINAICPLR